MENITVNTKYRISFAADKIVVTLHGVVDSNVLNDVGDDVPVQQDMCVIEIDELNIKPDLAQYLSDLPSVSIEFEEDLQFLNGYYTSEFYFKDDKTVVSFATVAAFEIFEQFSEYKRGQLLRDSESSE